MARLALAAAPLLLIPVPATQDAPASRLRGFTAKAAEEHRKLEARFLEQPKAEKCKEFLNFLTDDPHPAGSEQGRALADYVRARFLEYLQQGFDAELVSYEVCLSSPKKVEVTLVAPEEYKAKMQEVGTPWDKDSYASNALPPFHAGSPSTPPDGITADLVYANYGLPEDYDKLSKLGIDVRGKIVIVRYGKCYRGVKVREAELRKAAAVLIYSDPADDGYAKGDVVPRGPWRPETAVQRGSVSYMFIAPGDPLSPDWAARKGGGRRQEIESVRGASTPLATLPGIPSLPLSYGDAAPLLRNLAGPNVPEGWQGHLPFAYHVGPGPARVAMKVEMEFKDTLIHDVIGKWKGAERPDEWVVVGNHRDAWVHGAVDPGSGTAAMLEAVRGLGALKSLGFRPKRTIVFASWDAEEHGLIGSTEWCQEFAEEIAKKAVAYVNIDSGVSGRDFRAAASPTLAKFAREIAGAVEDPRERRSVLDVWRDRAKAKPRAVDAPYVGTDGDDPPVTELGSGSDYTAFEDHLGVPSLDIQFEGPYGVYHSVHDTLFWMETFGDRDFATHRALARLIGVAVLRLAQSDLLPIRPSGTAAAVSGHLADLARAYPDANPALDKLRAPIERLKKAADATEAEAEKAVEAADASGLESVNGRLLRFERELLASQGLRNRPFYKNLYSAPGIHAGYAAATLPGVREALESIDLGQRDEPRIAAEVQRLAERLGAAADLLEGRARPTPAGAGAPSGGGPGR
ncbi:MAG TPA: M28 family metallopeptidase [Planctomycetota bacterium]|nr:M28 family metallopeptidase [Planctomycetota bacterium]